MKRVRCPKCDHYITFDETKYQTGSRLVFECSNCNKQFGIRIGVSKLRKTQKEENQSGVDIPTQADYGYIHVIENVFHFEQNIPLRLGRNSIGRYQKGNPINCPIETVDPSVDLTHCAIMVSKGAKGVIKYTLEDGPSYTGTFVDNELLQVNEKRIITEGTLFTIGATSVILHTVSPKEDF